MPGTLESREGGDGADAPQFIGGVNPDRAEQLFTLRAEISQVTDTQPQLARSDAGANLGITHAAQQPVAKSIPGDA